MNTTNLGKRHEQLQRRQLLRLEDASGVRLVCTRGCLWVTQEGDTDDHVLDPDASLTLDRDGLTVVLALKDGGLFMEMPSATPEHAAQRLAMMAARPSSVFHQAGRVLARSVEMCLGPLRNMA